MLARGCAAGAGGVGSRRFDSRAAAGRREATTSADEAPTGRRPQLGLALSGGGFRAAFFHVGVLARLAETGLLRRVEVISTVSGGSIVGALYYLALKDLLENVPDDEVADEHYLRVVRRVERRLFDGAARNVRARAYASLGRNLRMRRADYSRSDRLGELYDELFYRPLWEEPLFGSVPAPRTYDGAIRMRELLVHPPGEDESFKPLRHNGRRRAPVPVLLLNATSLNTGHNWRFQAVEMGEDPRAGVWLAIDKNERLLSARWEHILPRQQDFELGHAVAASACVPGLFHPLAVSGLYEELRVQLVDGGVHDNQGVGGLLDTGVERLIVSDASGQMGDLAHPSTRIPAALGRSASIYGDRVREEQLAETLTRPGTVLVHLRKGLPAPQVSPLGPDGRPLAPAGEPGRLDFGVDEEVQRRLSSVRTDLDAFSEIEAYSLALSAHAQASAELPEPAALAYEWELDPADLETLRAQLASPGEAYLRQLDVARRRFLKAVALSGRVRAAAAVAGLAALALLGFCAYLLAGPARGSVPAWTLALALVAPTALVALYLKQRFRLRRLYAVADWLFTWLLPVLLAPAFWLAARAMLAMAPPFLAAGRIRRLAREPAPEAAPVPRAAG